MVHLVECSPCLQKVLGFKPQHCRKLSLVVYSCNPSAWEIQARGSEVKGILGYLTTLRPAVTTGDPLPHPPHIHMVGGLFT